MSEAVFVDAFAGIAITNRKDRDRREAVRIFRRLLSTPTALLTTNWTAYEALTIIKSRLGFNQAERLWQRIRTRAVVELVALTNKLKETLWNFSGGIGTKHGEWSTAAV
jgi:predicted nucleic acid-binding protein